MKKIYLLGLLGFGLFGSCSNEELTDGSLPTKGNYTIEATIGDIQTRTSVDENFNVQWNKEDQIGIYGKTSNQNVPFTLIGEGGSANGQFTGTFTNDIPVYGYYPYQQDAKIANKALTMTLPKEYTYTSDSNGPMVATYTDGSLSFKHLCGLLKVTVNYIPATATKFVLTGSSAIAGKASATDITAKNATLALSSTEAEVSKTITVTLAESAITNKEFYFPLPTGTYETLKVSLQNASSEVLYEKTSSNVVITRAGAVNMPMLDASIACLQEIAKSGGTYTLVSDMTGDITISAGKPVIINLNGHTINNKSGDTFTVNNGSTLTINGAGTVDNVTHAKACIYNNGTLILNGGTYTRSEEAENSTSSSGGNSYYNILNHGVMTIESGVTVSSNGAFSSLIDNGYYNYTDTNNERIGYVDGKGHKNPSLTINGGTFDGGINTIKNDDGANLIINNGTFTNTTQATVQNNNVAEIKGGSFTPTSPASHAVESKAYATEYNKGETTISGGTFTGKLYLSNGTGTTNASFNITGGTFSDPNALNYSDDDANITVQLVANTQLEKSIIVGKGTATIDLNNHTLTAANTATTVIGTAKITAITVQDGAKVTIKNGNINGGTSNLFYGVYAYKTADVTLNNVSFGEKTTYAYNGAGKLTASDCTFKGWLSGWNYGGTFTNCTFTIGKAYYPASICYGSTTFTNCKFFKNGIDADTYDDNGSADEDGYYRCNYVVAGCNPATTIDFVTCKFIDASNTETSVSASDHPYHACGWGDGKVANAQIKVDATEITSKCSDSSK